MSVGQNIRRFRTEKKLTQKKLGELSNINEVQIRQYELGKANPKIETIEKIANALEISTMSLLYGSFGAYKEEYHKTTEYKELQQDSLAHYATLKLLECIYKRAENIDVNIYKNGTLSCSSDYISIGEGENKIAIGNDVFPKIIDIIKTTLTSLVELTGENETQYIETWKKQQDVDSLSFSIPEHAKIILEDENNNQIPYIDPF